MTPELKTQAIDEILQHFKTSVFPTSETPSKWLAEKFLTASLEEIERMHKEYLAAKRSTDRAISQKIDLMETGKFNDGYVQGRLAGVGVAPKTAEAITSTLYNLASK